MSHKKNIGAIVDSKGVAFRVWAPFAQSVAVTGSFNGWGRTALESESDGYWYAHVKKAEAGQEYKFVVTAGGQELYKNDPRSLGMTTATGNSIIVDQSFDWQDDNFTAPPLNQQIIYELHVGTFHRPDPAVIGTFADASAKLDYLAELGVNMVELMPICTMAMDRGWGYATDYIYAVESLYGGRREFLEFVKAAHKRGIGVILDVVYNHFGPGGDLWQFDGWSENGKGGIYFYNDWRSETPWGETRPDFGRPEVRQYILDNIRMWLHDCRVDGLRVDSTIYIRNVRGFNNDPPDDLPDGWNILQQITAEAKKIKPSAVVIAEDVSGNEYITKPTGEGGAGFSCQWEVVFPGALRDTLYATDDSNRNLTGIGYQLNSRYNGDAFQKVVYSDSHDSDANGGVRLSEGISPGNPTSVYARKRSLQAAAIILSAPGMPMLFQGQEFMEGGSFNDWQALDWSGAKKFAPVVKAYQDLIALRKNAYGNTAGLSGQSLNILHLNDENKVLAYHRWDKGGPGDDVIVVFNFANRVQKNYVINFPRDGLWRVRFNSSWRGYGPDFKELPLSEVDANGGNGSLDLAPYGVLILSQ